MGRVDLPQAERVRLLKMEERIYLRVRVNSNQPVHQILQEHSASQEKKKKSGTRHNRRREQRNVTVFRSD